MLARFTFILDKFIELKRLTRTPDYRNSNTIRVRGNVLYLPDSMFDGWLSQIGPENRLAGMYLAIHSTAVTKAITGGVFKSLRLNLSHLHTDTDANFRRELTGHVQKLFDRLRGSTTALVKLHTTASITQSRLPFPQSCSYQLSTAQEIRVREPLIEALRFIVWYVRFLEGELRPDASYQRRVSALRALIVVLKSGLDPRVPQRQLSKKAQGQLQWMHQLQISSLRLGRSLLELIMDPYDDIREAAVSALKLCLESMTNEQRELAVTDIPRFIARAEAAMLRTGRADHADGVARAYALYFSTCELGSDGTDDLHRTKDTPRIEVLGCLNQQLKDTLDVARQSLSKAVEGRPVHGTYAAIRFVTKQY
jgi:hypothetical protein